MDIFSAYLHVASFYYQFEWVKNQNNDKESKEPNFYKGIKSIHLQAHPKSIPFIDALPFINHQAINHAIHQFSLVLPLENQELLVINELFNMILSTGFSTLTLTQQYLSLPSKQRCFNFWKKIIDR